jgi:putative addiction module killer protein
VIDVRQTDRFREWLRRLRDDRALARIIGRIRRLEMGDPGDVKSVGGGVLEMRVDHGPGYRLYYTQIGRAVVILLCGGDKRRQAQDIRRAKIMADELKE